MKLKQAAETHVLLQYVRKYLKNLKLAFVDGLEKRKLHYARCYIMAMCFAKLKRRLKRQGGLEQVHTNVIRNSLTFHINAWF